jgi:hypothetical protein
MVVDADFETDARITFLRMVVVTENARPLLFSLRLLAVFVVSFIRRLYSLAKSYVIRSIYHVEIGA